MVYNFKFNTKVLLRYKLVVIKSKIRLGSVSSVPLCMKLWVWNQEWSRHVSATPLLLRIRRSSSFSLAEFEASLNYETLSQVINNQAKTNRSPEDEPSILLQQIKARG